MTDTDDRSPRPSTRSRTTAGADFVRELVDTFLQEAPAMLAELRRALAARRRRHASAAPRIR